VRQLHGEGLPVLGVIAGRGSQLDAMRPGLVDDPAFRLIDRFLTPQEVHDSFVQANVVVVPYLDATQSGVVAYAFGLGRPVVATRVGGLPDVVHDGVNGLLVPPRDAAALSGALRAVLTDPARAQAMAAASLRMGADELSWDRIAQRCGELYASLLRQRVVRAGHGHA
jgi:glycosyltransferase involved in cell wall biosynthesis